MKFKYICIIINLVFSVAIRSEFVIDRSGEFVLGGEVVGTTTGIQITASDVVLDLDGNIVTAGLDGIVIYAGVNNVTIKNGSISNVAGTGLIIQENCSDVTMQGVSIFGCAQSAVDFQGTSGNQITKSRFLNVQIAECCTGAGATRCMSLVFADDCRFQRVSITDNGSISNDVSMIYIEDSNRLIFQNDLISNNVGATLVGISCQDNTQSCIFRSCLILDNLAATGFTGMFFNSLTSTDHILFSCEVSNNQVDAGTNDELYGFQLVLVDGVVIEECTASGNINLGSSANSDAYGFFFDRTIRVVVIRSQSFLNRSPNDGSSNVAVGFFVGTTGAVGTGVKRTEFMHNVAFLNNAFNDARSFGFQVESAVGGNENNIFIDNRGTRNGPVSPIVDNQIIATSGTTSSPGGVPIGSITDLSGASLNTAVGTIYTNVRIV